MELLEKEIYKRYMDLIGVADRRCGMDAAAESRSSHIDELIDRYDAFCFDGYGTLYNRGSFVYPGAAEMFRKLRAAGKQMRLVTNAASDVVEVLAADATKRGFEFSAAETISSGSLLNGLAAKLRSGESASGSRKLNEIFYIGRETGKHVLEANGIMAVENPAEPVVAISSAKDTPESYAHAVEILRCPGSVLLVLNSDAWAPKIDGSREPVSGALSERLRRDSICESNDGKGCETYYLGKPFPEIWNAVRESLPSTLFGGREPRVLMIGDTLGTDIYGAHVAGVDAALLVGRNEPAAELEEDEKFLGVKPDWYLVT